MVKYIIKRVALAVVILLGVSIIIYSLVRMMPVVENGTVITLPYGAYIIATDQQRTPIKILVR